MKSIKLDRVLISGGGTGGHIFSAIAIAEEFYNHFQNINFLFIGSKNKMEMKKVPAAGFIIKGIWISGINRFDMTKNLLLPLKLIISLWSCYRIIKEFNPTLIIGTGGFVSGPVLMIANFLNIPIFLQEQNSFPGITNKFFAKKAKKIFVAYEMMEKFFPKEKIFISGNPVRLSFIKNLISKKDGKIKLGLDPNKKCILSIGGSLGSHTMNKFWKKNINNLPLAEVELLWQTGSLEFIECKKKIINSSVKIIDFIDNISVAYSAADFIISRSGAVTISELCIVGKPIILIPFPFSAENHQNKNADYLVSKNAAIKVLDKNVEEQLLKIVLSLLQDKKKQDQLVRNLKNLQKINASKKIVYEILNCLENN